jgi:hypothetical protein
MNKNKSPMITSSRFYLAENAYAIAFSTPAYAFTSHIFILPPLLPYPSFAVILSQACFTPIPALP